MDRRTALAEGALEHVLVEGLIGLSLRPLAAALGTSDRMLIYHFGSKDGLVAAIVERANARVAERLPAATEEPGPAALVRYAWSVISAPPATAMMGLYLEMCVLAVRDPAHYAGAQGRMREPWLALLREGLAERGVAAERVPALADLVLDALEGLLLDRLVHRDADRADRAAEAFAELVGGCCAGSG